MIYIYYIYIYIIYVCVYVSIFPYIHHNTNLGSVNMSVCCVQEQAEAERNLKVLQTRSDGCAVCLYLLR